MKSWEYDYDWIGRYLKILLSDDWRIPHQNLNESGAFIPNINAVNLRFLLKLIE